MDDPLNLPTSADPTTGDSIRIVIAHVAASRDQGHEIGDAEVCAAHPDLMPELAEELRVMEQIRRARLAAEASGTLSEPLEALSDSQLEMPIEAPVEVEAETAEEFPTSDGYQVRQPALRGYAIVGEIGSGGQATVWKAVRQSTGRQVAVKVFAGGALTGSHARNRLNREAEVLASLDHPNIVGILDRGRLGDGTFYLVMPFVDGRPLDVFARQSMESETGGLRPMLQLFAKVCRAVEAAHANAIVHRDLKPSNILVDRWGEPHILDFGLAKLVDDITNDRPSVATLTGQVLGTAPWTSPEQASGDACHADARSDVYSLGVMLYEAITGRSPYLTSGPLAQVLQNIQKIVPVAPSRVERDASSTSAISISPTLDAIVLKALAKSAADRYASAGDLAEALGGYLPGSGTLGYEAPRTHWYRFPRLFAAIAIILAGGLILWREKPLSKERTASRDFRSERPTDSPMDSGTAGRTPSDQGRPPDAPAMRPADAARRGTTMMSPLPATSPATVEVSVEATHNAMDPISTGVWVFVGQRFILEPNLDDTWCGGGTHRHKFCNYRGYSDTPGWVAMKWQLGTASGLVTPGVAVIAEETGEIKLYAEDDKPEDNSGAIRAKVTVLGNESSIPSMPYSPAQGSTSGKKPPQ